ncbi:MAG: V-type ATPase 116kDa subunit family protein, partial [Pyramidobacter sp.]|nr:V-type ATPase 116kDa subunit family protein [Pyramidobacter sp.]
MIEPMCKLSLVAPISSGVPLFSFLQKDGRLHLVLPDARADSPNVSRLLQLREKQSAIIEALDALSEPSAGGSEISTSEIEKLFPGSLVAVLPEIEQSIEKFQDDLSAILDERKAYEEEKALLRKMLDQIGTPAFADSPGRDFSLWWTTRTAAASALKQIERNIAGIFADDSLGVQSHLRETSKEGQVLAEISVPDSFAASVRSSMAAVGAHMWTPPELCAGRNYIESIVLIKRRLSEINTAFEEEKKLLRKLQSKWGARQKAFFLLIDRELELQQALNRCEKVGNAIIVNAWLPEKQRADFEQKLNAQFGGTIALFSQTPDTSEYGRVPTLLSHKPFFEPFELFLKLVRVPAYGTTDPTVMIALFFPLFSGCIVGDAGYGIVMFALMWLLRRTTDKKMVRDVAFILMTVSVWSLFWGAAFGEFFGDFAHRMFRLEPLWVERSHAVMPVLAFSVVLGLAHVLLGMLTGVIQGIRGRHPRHAMEKCGGILVILSMVALLMSVRQLLPSGAFPTGVALLVVGLILLMTGGGVGGLVESMSSFGHILSYVRIGAIGLSSAILAVAASKFVDVLGVSALGLFMALAIHLLNFVLAFAESGLHSARLHYVEFMGNFYVDKGVAYKPFAYRRNISWKK